MIDVAFLKGQVVNLEQRQAEAVQSLHEINGGLIYARNLLAHAESQVAAAAEAAKAAEANAADNPGC